MSGDTRPGPCHSLSLFVTHTPSVRWTLNGRMKAPPSPRLLFAHLGPHLQMLSCHITNRLWKASVNTGHLNLHNLRAPSCSVWCPFFICWHPTGGPEFYDKCQDWVVLCFILAGFHAFVTRSLCVVLSFPASAHTLHSKRQDSSPLWSHQPRIWDRRGLTLTGNWSSCGGCLLTQGNFGVGRVDVMCKKCRPIDRGFISGGKRLWARVKMKSLTAFLWTARFIYSLINSAGGVHWRRKWVRKL